VSARWSQAEIEAMSAFERARLGIPFVTTQRKAERFTEAWWAEGYPDWLLEAIYQDLSKRNLRDYSNDATRELAGRLGAIRFERNHRKALGTYQGREILKATFHAQAA
jgi:hypothetical protein